MQTLIALYFRMRSGKKERKKKKQFQATACCGNMLEILSLFCCNVYLHRVLHQASRIKQLHFMALDAEGGAAWSGSARAVNKAAHLISVMPLFRRFSISRCIWSFTPSYEIQRSDLLYCLHFIFPLRWIPPFSDVCADDTVDNFMRFLLFRPLFSCQLIYSQQQHKKAIRTESMCLCVSQVNVVFN